MEKVYVYKDSYGDYRVYPGVIVIRGNDNLRVINATGVAVKVKVPAGASKPHDPVEENIPSQKHRSIKARKQGDDDSRAYPYKVTTGTGKRARANSDPIMIIEN